MLNYILKRLLLMIPTLFAIVLVVFLLVNIAPGTPGQVANASGSERADQAANTRESYRLFKLQYNLDKPIILNFRYFIGEERVVEALETLASTSSLRTPGEQLAHHVGLHSVAWINAALDNPPTPVELSREGRAASGDVIRAETKLEDWGEDVVPHLVRIVEGYVALRGDGAGTRRYAIVDARTQDRLRRGERVILDAESWRLDAATTERVRFLAVQRLSVSARRRVVVGEGERASEERLAENRAIVSENNRVSAWVWSFGAPPEEQAEVVAQWTGWFNDVRDERYTRSFGSNLYQTFFDTRFARYMGNLLPFDFSPSFRFRAPDLGTSMRYRRPVMEVIGEHWRYSVGLSIVSLLLAYIISVPIGVWGAVKRGHAVADRGVGVVLFILYSLPVFFGATLLQTWLTPARGLDWFPVSGFDDGRSLERTALEHLWVITKHMVLPVICLTYPSLAALSRYARSGLLEVIRADYIRTARAKGIPEWMVIVRHAVRNGMIPIITLLGSTLPAVIGGSIVIEYIFAIEGMGALMLQSIGQRDYNVIMGVLLLSSVLTLIGILLSDIAYALVDPRISFD